MRSPRLTASREGLAPFVDRPQSLQNMASLQGYVDRASLYSLPSRSRLTPPPSADRVLLILQDGRSIVVSPVAHLQT